MSFHVLDNPVWHALETRQEELGKILGAAACYHTEVSPLAALAAASREALGDLGKLRAAGEFAALAPLEEADLVGAEWEVAGQLPLLQMVCEEPVRDPPEVAGALSGDDVDEMLKLVEVTQPGPFARRTIEMGPYVGVREDGRLIAMAGERMRPPGYAEVSAVCTDPTFRGRGLAEALVRAVSAAIQARDEVPFLHVMETSPSAQTAIALYERIGFRARRKVPAVALVRR